MIEALAIVRAAHLCALMMVFGAEALHFLFARGHALPPAALSPARFSQIAAATALITSLIWLCLTAAVMSGSNLPDAPAIMQTFSQTLFGRVMVARIAFLTLLVTALSSRRAISAGVPIVLSGLALAAIALTSHPAASGDARFLPGRAFIDALHLLAAAFWIGGLAALVPMVRGPQPAALLPALRIFSRWAMGAVAILIAAGSLNAYFILFGGTGRWSLSYISLLAAKIVLAALMVAMALANRFGL